MAKVPKINNAHGPDTRNIINRAIDVLNQLGISTQDLVAKGQLTPSQYAQLINIVNENAKIYDLDDLEVRLNEILTETATGVSQQEIVDARQGKGSLGDNIRDISDRTNLKINNLLTDGDFRSGTDDWQGGPNVSVTRSAGRLVVAKTSAVGWLFAERNLSLSAGNTYHISIGHLKQSTQEDGTAPIVNMYYTDGTFQSALIFENNTNIQSKSVYFTPTKNVEKIRITSYRSASGANYTLDKISVINVSDAFGDNMPTIQELETVIDEYFNGFIDANASLSHSIASLLGKQIAMENNFELSISNMIPGSDFTNGLDDWIGNVNSDVKVVSGKLRATNITAAANIQSRRNIELVSQSNYFLQIKGFKQSVVGTYAPTIILYYTDNTFETIHTFANNTQQQDLFMNFKPNKTVRQIGFVSYLNNEGNSFDVDEVNLIDLVENFGKDVPSPEGLKGMLESNFDRVNGHYRTTLPKTVQKMMSASGSGGGSAISIKTTLTLEAHGLDKNTGRILPSTNTNYSTMKRTGKYLKVVSGTDLRVVFSGGTFTVFEYDNSFNLIAQKSVASNSVHKLNLGTQLVKIMSENYSGGTVEMTFYGPSSTVQWVKNERRTAGNHNFIFEVNPTIGRDIRHTDTSKFNDNQFTRERYYTSGLLKLPPNYSPDGDPVKLIVFAHGSNDYNAITDQSFGRNFENYFQYLADEGYAIMDVFSWTTKYPNAVGANFGSPIAKSGLMQGYEWVKDNYNIDNSGVFVSGKSAGGYQAVNFLYNNAIPIKAAGLLAPALIPIHQPFGYNGSTKTAYAHDFGFDGDINGLLNVEGSVLPMTPALRTFITANAHKLIGYIPNWNGIINGDFDTMLTNALDKNEKMSVYQNLSRVNNIPTKIWAAIDDGDDDWGIYGNSRQYIHTLKNAQNIAEMRTMPANTGGHNAVDSSPDALKVSTITTRLGITHTNVPLAYVELVSWFSRFEA